MLNKMRNTQGFTLIELLIVVAIIGILAAVAIPQFSAYRIKGYNTAAATDLGNAKLAEGSFNTDSGGVYASSVMATGAPGVGTVLDGPQAVIVNIAVNGISAGFPTLAMTMPFGISNGVSLGINTTAAPAAGSAYLAGAGHTQGDQTYLFDSDSTAVRKLKTLRAVGTKVVAADIPASTTGVDDLNVPATYVTM